jgi:hypothetical protein
MVRWSLAATSWPTTPAVVGQQYYVRLTLFGRQPSWLTVYVICPACNGLSETGLRSALVLMVYGAMGVHSLVNFSI